MKFCVVLQASGIKKTAFKNFKKIYKNYTSLSFLIENIKKSKNNLVVATTNKTQDNKLVSWCKKNKIIYFRGLENNVFERQKYYKKFKIENVIRHSDCPYRFSITQKK